MSTRKTSKKPIQRIVQRRKRNIVTLCLVTLVFSSLSVLLSYLLVKEPVLVSPLPKETLGVQDTITQNLDKKLRSMSLTPVNITKNADEITIRFEKDAVVVLSTKRDIDEQLGSLQLIMRQLTMEGKRFGRIDLRFNKPVIRE